MVSTSGCAKADEVDLVGHLSPVIGVGDDEETVAELVEWPRLRGFRVEYPTGSSRFREFCKAKSSIDVIRGYAFRYRATDGVYLSSSSLRPCFFDLSSAGRVWNDNLLWVSGECFQRSDEEPLELNNRTITKGISCKVSRKESFIDVVAKEGTELEAVLKELEISSKEEKLLTPEHNTPSKLVQLNEMPDGPVDMATVSSTVVVLEESDKVVEGADLRPHFEVEAGLLEEQCRAKAREKMVAVVDDEFSKEIASSRLRVVELEGMLEVEKKSSAKLQKELDVAREREEQTHLYNAEYADEYGALFSQYKDRLDDNVKLSLKLEEAKRQVEDKTAIILSRDLALNQLISELAELKDKGCVRDGEIASGEESREMKEFLRRKEELVENMRIDLTNSQQKSIDLTRQMSERIDQLTAELTESKARRLKDNKRAAVIHQSFKELVVHEQDKCDGEALHQRQLSALVTFFVEEIKFLLVERDLMQDCFSGRTCVCKLDISSIDPIGVMDRGIETMTAEQIARGRKIVAERALEYMASGAEIGGSSGAVSPTPAVGGRLTALPSRKSSRI
ncbi:hypothetical protein GIB67_042695 [Kingdonia uniflora]|uniref:Uncharacterized protein n=1 Tax=Kingdonia uniflora TaxID=39325 RepID=A0A7J7NDG3_9MAGN|nr:hypothetical protein GIB67_042695 [Kingdonia uniflora]